MAAFPLMQVMAATDQKVTDGSFSLAVQAIQRGVHVFKDQCAAKAGAVGGALMTASNSSSVFTLQNAIPSSLVGVMFDTDNSSHYQQPLATSVPSMFETETESDGLSVELALLAVVPLACFLLAGFLACCCCRRQKTKRNNDIEMRRWPTSAQAASYHVRQQRRNKRAWIEGYAAGVMGRTRYQQQPQQPQHPQPQQEQEQEQQQEEREEQTDYPALFRWNSTESHESGADGGTTHTEAPRGLFLDHRMRSPAPADYGRGRAGPRPGFLLVPPPPAALRFLSQPSAAGAESTRVRTPPPNYSAADSHEES